MNNVVTLKHEIRFLICNDWNKQLVDDSSLLAIDELVAFLKLRNNLSIEIGWFTDARGSAANNQSLTDKRSKIIRGVLIEKGIDSTRLFAVGYGESHPKTIFKTETEHLDAMPKSEAYEIVTLDETYINRYKKSDKSLFEKLHAINRRLEFKIVELKN